MKPVICTLTVLVLAAAPTASSAQVLRGRIADHASHAILPGVRVLLLDDRGSEVAQVTTNAAGLFELKVPRGGAFSVRASLVGYHAFTSEPFDLAAGDIVQLALQLSVQPISLKPVVVRTTPDRGSRLAEFEQRRKRNEGGVFITRQDIERRPSASSSELLTGIRGVSLPASSSGRYTIMLRRGLGACEAHVYVNGVEFVQSPSQTIDDLLIPDWLGGVEVYPSAAFAPLDYRRADGCGVVLFWTRGVEQGGSWRWIKLAAAAGFVAAAVVLTR